VERIHIARAGAGEPENHSANLILSRPSQHRRSPAFFGRETDEIFSIIYWPILTWFFARRLLLPASAIGTVWAFLRTIARQLECVWSLSHKKLELALDLE
jgi:hypothetical protein